MAWGLEARVPFLDKAFLDVAMNIDPAEKMFHKGASQEVDEDGCPKMEKVCAVWPFPSFCLCLQYILRKAFDHSPDGKVGFILLVVTREPHQLPIKPYLPRSILWRQKEQFSDGVGYSWIDGWVPFSP